VSTARARTATAIRFDPDIHDQLVVAAEARGVSVNFLVNAALRHALPLLVPPDQVRWFADQLVSAAEAQGPGGAQNYGDPPHSRACGIIPHEHGTDCHTNCPTCGGRPFPEGTTP
jgi:uncharacterized protein (DUF1778 family)